MKFEYTYWSAVGVSPEGFFFGGFSLSATRYVKETTSFIVEFLMVSTCSARWSQGDRDSHLSFFFIPWLACGLDALLSKQW